MHHVIQSCHKTVDGDLVLGCDFFFLLVVESDIASRGRPVIHLLLACRYALEEEGTVYFEEEVTIVRLLRFIVVCALCAFLCALCASLVCVCGMGWLACSLNCMVGTVVFCNRSGLTYVNTNQWCNGGW